ncbi:DEAD/DEAH box helicase [Furfurilactobacillus sp. WILCCON 0119]
MNPEQLYGRQLLSDELSDVDLRQVASLQRRPAMSQHGRRIRCERCQTWHASDQVRLATGTYFCPACLTLGRVTSRQQLVGLPEQNAFNPPVHPLTWQGELTRLQTACAQVIVTVFQQRRQHLLWAVTGAGKTEMLFPGLADALARGDRIAVASPRVDVCLELAPRLKRAFAGVPIAVLHGRQTRPYAYRQLTVCTTHQLYRFYHAFDVIVVDEVDAFPFAHNPRLAVAVATARKLTGATLYLTATPSRALLRDVHHGRLTLSYLPLRFHGHVLPELTVRLAINWRRQLARHHLPAGLLRVLSQFIKREQRFLLFVPHVAQLAVVAKILTRVFPKLTFATVHATDPERLEKVTAMRERQVQGLITTTILERGVTLPGIDVLILGADDPVFSSAALVQMAGRAGRSADRPTGLVCAWVSTQTRTIKEAQRQIRLVNRKGRRLPEWQPV